MYIIHFKNGTKYEIDQIAFNIICNNLAAGCDSFQLFTDDSNEFSLVINLSEIVCIDWQQ